MEINGNVDPLYPFNIDLYFISTYTTYTTNIATTNATYTCVYQHYL